MLSAAAHAYVNHGRSLLDKVKQTIQKLQGLAKGDSEEDSDEDSDGDSQQDSQDSSPSQSSSDSTPSAGGGSSGGSGGGGLSAGDVDGSTNSMAKKTYIIYRSIAQTYDYPSAQRDNMSDQFTPQDHLVHMEKTVRDFLKLEEKIYDPESTNPRFFASEDWVQHYEKDKNVILAAMDQFKANILRMQHLYNLVDLGTREDLSQISNEDVRSGFQANVFWTARCLKDWADNWFIKGNSYSQTGLSLQDYWLPGTTGLMVQWMKGGTWVEATSVRSVGIAEMAAGVDRLEGQIDRLDSGDSVEEAISTHLNLKETLERSADQTKEQTFTSKVIDSTMGRKLGVTAGGDSNDKGKTSYKAPSADDVESVQFTEKVSGSRKTFRQLRGQANDLLAKGRTYATCGPGAYAQIWEKIDELASYLYKDMDILNELVCCTYGDFVTLGMHCSVTHQKLDPVELKTRISAFKGVIQQGVVDVVTNQALLPKMGSDIYDSMFNQLWEYGEKGPIVNLPSWCLMAIESIDSFERSMGDVWSEVFDCWEREFASRLWEISTDHHSGNWERTQTAYVKTIGNHIHNYVPFTGFTLASMAGDSKNMDTTPMKGQLTCPRHLEKLMAPVCVQYRLVNVAHLARCWRKDLKELCSWMVSAIEAIGIRQASISAVMADPSLNGSDSNGDHLAEIAALRKKNDDLLSKVEDAYAIYSDVNNLKNRQDYQDEIALAELQAKKYSNEDQLNMTSSTQTESRQSSLSAELSQGGIDVDELKPWNHLSLSGNKVEPKSIPVTPPNNDFDQVVQTAANFETMFGKEEESSGGEEKSDSPSSLQAGSTGAAQKVANVASAAAKSYANQCMKPYAQAYQTGTAVAGAAGMDVGNDAAKDNGQGVQQAATT